MLLSFLIPVYNMANYLPELLEKLLPYVTEDMEIIFYDDASTDDSISIINKFSKIHPNASIKLIIGSENVGLTLARKNLLKSSCSKYIWFVDADDKLESSLFEQIKLILLEKNPDVMLFNYDVFYDKINKIKSIETLSFFPRNCLVKSSSDYIYCISILDGKHYFWNKIFKRELVYEVIDFHIPAFEDIAYTPILLNQCKNFYYLTETVVHYRIRSNSIVQKMSSNHAYGIKAYLDQASYAAQVVHSSKCEAYLLYKACMYYYRLSKDIKKASLNEKEKNRLMELSQMFFNSNNLSKFPIISCLIKYGMIGKAIKLIYKSITFKFCNIIS